MKYAAAKSLQSCPTLCDPIDGSPPGFPVPGMLQARTLEWVAISFSNAWKWKVKVKSLSRAWLLATPLTADYQASPSMGFSRQEYWSGLPLPSPYWELVPAYLFNQSVNKYFKITSRGYIGLPWWLSSKESCRRLAGNMGSNPGSGRSPLEEDKASPLEKAKATYSSILTWRIHGLVKSWTWLKCLSTHAQRGMLPSNTYFRNPKKYFSGEKVIIDRRIEVNKK